jgi:competence protein ComEC
LLLAAAAIALVVASLPSRHLRVDFLDVGQGDAILIRAPGGYQILVDGGPSPAALLSELGEVLPFWDRTLDMVILTHPDGDHMNGLIELLGRYRVHSVLDLGEGPAVWEDVVAQSGARRVVAAHGTQIRAGKLVLAVLHPHSPPSWSDSRNDDSLVLRLDYGERSFLLTADAGSATEAAMMASGAPLDADVLKVGHHGSDGGTGEAFLRAVSPAIAVIQVGSDNTYGLPAPPLLERLAGVRTYRTDQDGRIEIGTDGDTLWAVEERK